MGIVSRIKRGAPFYLAGLLLMGSVGARLYDSGRALASSAETAPSAAAPTDSGQSCEAPPDLEAILQQLQTREIAIAKRERELDLQAHDQEIARQQILANLEALERAEIRLSDRMALSSAASEDDLTRLTAVYAAMKPKDAAAVFEAMEPEFAAGFLGRMPPESAAGVLSGLRPETAYALSVILAGRNANAATE